MNKKIIFSYFIIMTALCGLIIRLFFVSQGETLAQAAQNQSTKTIEAANNRGTIYDYKLKSLVNEEEIYTATVIPTPEAMDAIMNNINNNEKENAAQKFRDGSPFIQRLKSPLKTKIEGIEVFSSKVRYNYNQLAPHIIGYLNDTKDSGIYGCEKIFNKELSKANGEITVTYKVDAMGRLMGGIKPEIKNTIDNSKNGIVLTLDKDIQKIAQDVAKKYLKAGAVVIMDIKTGEIRASVSVPDYSPLDVGKALRENDSPFLNRTFTQYNLGSIFKLVSAAAYLEAGGTIERQYKCKGNITVGNNVFSCHNINGHDVITMREAISKSCNPYFISLMQEVGPDIFYEYVNDLGFGKASIFYNGLKTDSGVIPSRESLDGPAVLANLSFGQGELLATPVQVACLISCIANNGIYNNAKLIKGTTDGEKIEVFNQNNQEGKQVLSTKTALQLQTLMSGVMKEDATGEAAKPNNVKAAGKTATAQTGIIKDGKEVDQSWFAGFFPSDDPKYAVVTLGENTDEGRLVTCPCFKEIAEKITILENKIQE